MQKVFIYENGLKVVFQKMHGSKALAIGVAVGTGSSEENGDINGIAHFTEHMLFKGTAKRSAFDIANDLEKIGVNVNAYTTKAMTMYYTLSSGEYIEQCLEVLSDMFFDSAFDQAEIEKEKGVIAEEINGDLDNPDAVCFDNIARAYYGNKSYGLKILGKSELISQFKTRDFKEFSYRKYSPDNVVISLAGNMGFNKAKDLVDRYFSSRFDSRFKVSSEKQITPVFDSIVEAKDIQQANLAIAFPSCTLLDDTYRHSLFQSLTTGGMSSRLFQQIRELQGLVYDISFHPRTYLETGTMTLYLATSAKLAEKALSETFKELQKIKSEGFTQEELSKGKEQIKLKMMLMVEQAISMMRLNASSVMNYGKPYEVENEICKMSNTGMSDIDDFVATSLDFDKMATSYVGNDQDFDVRMHFC